MIVTLYKNVKDVSNGFKKDVRYALERIRDGKSKSIIEQIRKLEDKDKKNILKATLPGVCFNGSFKHRKETGLEQHSGLMIVDYDDIPIEEVENYKNELKNKDYFFAIWISPSGNGIKALVKIPPEKNNHKQYFQSFKKHTDDKYLDNSGSDVSRFCFESYDPEIYINEDSIIWNKLEEPEVEDIGHSSDEVSIPLTSSNQIVDHLLKWWQKKYGATKGERNVNVYKLAIAFNDFGISKHDAEYQCMKFQSNGFQENEIKNIVKSAYSNTANFNTKCFEDIDTTQKIEKQIRTGNDYSKIKKKFPDIDSSALESYVDSVKENLDLEEFWYYDDKNKIKLSIHKFKFWLEQNNFFKFYPSDESTTFTFIKREQNLIEETDANRIKDFVLEYLLDRSNIGYGPYDFMASNSKYFNQDFLSMLDTIDVDLKKDEKEKCYLYYQNCVLEITKDGVNKIDYFNIDGYVWKRSIIDRKYKEVEFKNSEYKRFIELVSNEDEGKFKSFQSAIGYMLHSFKNSANNKAVILNDETISEAPNGGSGKGLFWNALKYMKNVAFIDGKKIETADKFGYQTVSTDTQVLVFDDVKQKFKFEDLFSVITEGITLEYKNQPAIQLSVEESPKIIITTNYTLGGVGGSHERRKFEIEFSSYFSYLHTPLEEFGHMMFSDWNEKEWQMFDNFMIDCVKVYLSEGLIEHDFINLEVRKFIKETSYEFYEWASSEENSLAMGVRHDKSMKFMEFTEDYTDYKKWLSKKKFTNWLNQWGKYNKYKITDGKSGPMRWIMYGEYKTSQSDYYNFDDATSDAPF